MKYLLLIVLVLATQAKLRKVDGLPECFKDISDIVTKCQDIISTASSGNPDLAKILADAQAIATDVQAATHDCHLAQPSESKNIANCVHDVEDMIKQVKDIISQAKSGKPNFA
jgi:cell pole-organizing protein PopZ